MKNLKVLDIISGIYAEAGITPSVVVINLEIDEYEDFKKELEGYIAASDTIIEPDKEIIDCIYVLKNGLTFKINKLKKP